MLPSIIAKIIWIEYDILRSKAISIFVKNATQVNLQKKWVRIINLNYFLNALFIKNGNFFFLHPLVNSFYFAYRCSIVLPMFS